LRIYQSTKAEGKDLLVKTLNILREKEEKVYVVSSMKAENQTTERTDGGTKRKLDEGQRVPHPHGLAARRVRNESGTAKENVVTLGACRQTKMACCDKKKEIGKG